MAAAHRISPAGKGPCSYLAQATPVAEELPAKRALALHQQRRFLKITALELHSHQLRHLPMPGIIPQLRVRERNILISHRLQRGLPVKIKQLPVGSRMNQPALAFKHQLPGAIQALGKQIGIAHRLTRQNPSRPGEVDPLVKTNGPSLAAAQARQPVLQCRPYLERRPSAPEVILCSAQEPQAPLAHPGCTWQTVQRYPRRCTPGAAKDRSSGPRHPTPAANPRCHAIPSPLAHPGCTWQTVQRYPRRCTPGAAKDRSSGPRHPTPAANPRCHAIPSPRGPTARRARTRAIRTP